MNKHDRRLRVDLDRELRVGSFVDLGEDGQWIVVAIDPDPDAVWNFHRYGLDEDPEPGEPFSGWPKTQLVTLRFVR
jgi:hypothetical protein